MAARLDPNEALLIYGIIKQALGKGYGLTESTDAQEYQGWTRFDTAPYLSSTHGNHYLNNYANSIASAYGQFENAGELPIGSVIVKDSFSVTESHQIVLGPLSIMEKMPTGFNYVSGDWKFTQIQPDGTILGETNGRGSDRVEYCVACHLSVQHQDHLFFLPAPFRVRP